VIRLEALEDRCLLASLQVGTVVDINKQVHNQAQPAIAVNPANPQNLAAASESVDDAGIMEASSFDGGQTWTSHFIADGSSDSLPKAFGTVNVSFDDFGDLFLSYIDDQNEANTDVVMSTDGGKTFTPLTTIKGLSGAPRMVTGSGGSVAPQSIWVEGESSSGVVVTGAPITAPGQVGTFGAPAVIPGTNSFEAYGVPTIGPKGQFAASFQDAIASNGPSNLYVAVDPDGLGPTPIGAAITVTANNFGGVALVPPQPVAGVGSGVGIAYDDSGQAHNGRLYLVKTDRLQVSDTNSGIFLEHSDDDGKTWSADVFVDDSNHNATLILPRVAVDPTTGVVAVSWLDTRNDPGSGPGDTDGKPNTDVEEFATISLDGGDTFLPNVQVASGPSNAIKATGFAGKDDSGFDFGGYTGLAFYAGVFFPAWPDNSPKLAGNPDPNNLDIATAAVTVVGGPTPVGTLKVKPVAITASEGQAFSGNVATFAPPNPSATASDFTATIAWGDGASSKGTVVTDPLGGFDVTGSHTYTEGGHYSAQVVVTPTGKAPGTGTSPVTVSDAPLTGSPVAVSAAEGSLFSGVVATFTDADPSPTVATAYHATIDWGDGTSTAGLVSATTGGGFQVSGSHTLAGGTVPIHVTITDAGGASVQVASTATVADAPIVTSSVTITGVEGTAFTGTVATFFDQDTRNLGSNYYAATINWGDGTTTAGTVAAAPGGGFVVTGDHLFSFGTHAVQVTIHDGDVTQAVANSTATITDAPLTTQSVNLAPTEGVAFQGVVGWFFDADPKTRENNFTATVDWGDGTSSAGRVSYEGDHAFTVVAGHAYASGTHNFTVHVQEVGHPEITLAVPGTATVADAPLTITAGPAAHGVEGVALAAVAGTFTDPSPLARPTDFSATINWGDGTNSPALVMAVAGGGFQVIGVHAFAQPGTYSVSASINHHGQSAGQVGTRAVVGDAPLSALGATVTATQNVPFGGVVATFTDANSRGQAGENRATINWGDGTISAGLVANARGGGFSVIGAHIFGSGGSFPITVTIASTGGSTATAIGTAAVRDVLGPLVGALSPLSDSGLSHTDGITNITQPTFVGSASPGSVVLIAAVPLGSNAPTLVGQGTTDVSGHWAATTLPLPSGAYSIFAVATNAAGRPASPVVALMPSASRGPLIIDTTGPRVLSATLNPASGQVRLTFVDDLFDLGSAALNNPPAYSLALMGARGSVTPLPLTSLVAGPPGPTNVATAIATFGGGRRLSPGTYALILSPVGLTDLAGNPLASGISFTFSVPAGPGGNNTVTGFLINSVPTVALQPTDSSSDLSGAAAFRRFLRSHGRP
jgi:hypothetical protein